MSLKPIPNRIFVGGLKEFIKQEDLYNYFSSFGSVKDVKIIQDNSNVPKGNYGFVTFFDPGVVEKILSCDNDSSDVRTDEVPLKSLRDSNNNYEEDNISRITNEQCCKSNFCLDCLREIRGIHENIDSLKRQVNILIDIVKTLPISQDKVWKNESWFEKIPDVFHENKHGIFQNSIMHDYESPLTIENSMGPILGQLGDVDAEYSRINEKYQREFLSLQNDSDYFNCAYKSLISTDSSSTLDIQPRFLTDDTDMKTNSNGSLREL